MWIAVDLGKGHVKAKSEYGKEVLFSSIVSKGAKRSVLSNLSEESNLLNHLQVDIRSAEGEESTHYYIGEYAAQFGIFPMYPIGKETFKQETARILIWTAIALLVPNNKRHEPINLAIGFPYTQYDLLKNKFEEYIRSATPTLQLYEEQLYTIKIGKIQSYQQGWAAAYKAKTEHEELNKTDGFNVFVDIGAGETQLVTLRNIKGELHVDESYSSTLEYGTTFINELIRPRFEKETGDRLTNEIAKEIIQNGTYFYDGKDIDFSADIEQAKKDLAMITKEFLNQKLGKIKPRIRTFFMTGGGSTLLGEYLKGYHRSQKYLERAQWSNVDGYLFAAIGKNIRDVDKIKEIPRVLSSESPQDKQVETEGNKTVTVQTVEKVDMNIQQQHHEELEQQPPEKQVSEQHTINSQQNKIEEVVVQEINSAKAEASVSVETKKPNDTTTKHHENKTHNNKSNHQGNRPENKVFSRFSEQRGRKF